MYEDAVRIGLEMGKASTSTLQRRLRLGYGRAARILDMMQREGIIGPPDGSRPREVLKRPDWLQEVRPDRLGIPDRPRRQATARSVAGIAVRGTLLELRRQSKKRD
jgi:hypothetical protein